MATRTQKLENNIWDKIKLEEGWFSFLALLLAFMTVVWSIEGAHWAEGSQLLPRAALVSFFIGFGLARVKFVPGLLAHSFIVSVGLVFVGLLVSPYGDTQYTEWTRRLGSTVLTVVRWCEDAIQGKAHDNNLVYLASLTFGVWVLGYASAWLLFRSHKAWWTLAMLGAVLMINLSFNPPNSIYSFSFFLIVSLLLLVRFNVFQDEQRWRSLRLYFQPGIWRMAMAVGGCLALVVMAVAFATPSSSQIESFGQVLNKASQPFNGIKGVWDIVGSGGAEPGDAYRGRANTNYNALADSFTIGGPLRLSNDPVLRVKTEGSAAPSYLQTQTMDQYDGKGWINTYQLALDKSPNDILFRKLSLASNQALPTPTDEGKRSAKMTLTPLVPNFNLVLSLGDLVSLDRASLVAFHYIKTSINAQLTAFQLKDIPDGNGGKRSVLIDQTTGKTVPPAALDLIKYLKQGSQMNELAIPPTFTFTYINSGNSYTVGEYRLGTDGKPIRAPLTPSGFSISTSASGNWFYNVPSIDTVKALNLQPGSTKVINKLNGATVKNARGETIEVESSVYLSSSGDYLVTLESPYSRGDSAKNRFEATDVGQKVKAEIKKLEDSVKGNKVTYALVNGKPASLTYEGYEPNYDDLTGATLTEAIPLGESYTTQARRYGADVLSLRQTAAGDYPDWVGERYLQLPANFSPGIKALAEELTAGLTTPYDKAMAIQSYLRSLNYTTDPPPTPDGRDEIDFFLFDSKSGYCVHFSSAMVLMLRSLNIPTREVTGFIGGEFDGATNSWVVRGSAAHAWPQVYFKNVGWVDFEPTPNQDNIQRPADPSAVPPEPVSTPPAPLITPSTGGNDQQDGPDRIKGILPQPGGNTSTTETTYTPDKSVPLWLYLLLGAALVGTAVFFARRFYLKRVYGLPDLSPLAIYNRMSQSARKAGLRGRSGMTPYEYGVYLKQQVPDASDSVDAITRAYVRRRYGPETADLEDIKHQQHVSALVTAEHKLDEATRTGHDAKQEDLWQLFKARTDIYNDDHSARVVWEDFQEKILVYRRQKRLDRMTPEFVRQLQQRAKRLRPDQG